MLVENLTTKLNQESELVHAVVAPRMNEERNDEFWVGNTQVFSVDAPDPLQYAHYSKPLEALITERKLLASVLLKVRRIVDRCQPRLIHIHGFSLIGYTASAVAEIQQVPYVMHVHGSVEDVTSTRMKHQVQKAVAVICVSESVRLSVVEETGRSKDVMVIRNGHNDSAKIVGSRKHHEIRDSIVMVGRLEPSKGFDYALRALAPMIAVYPDLSIDIVGVGREDEKLEVLVSQLGIGSSVTFHGRLDHDETLDLLNESICVVVPSIAYEGFSLVALESAQLERPVVASNVGGLPETVLDGITGTIVDPLKEGAIAEAVRNYLLNPELAHIHGTRARERALTEFSMDRMVQEIQEIHSNVLGVTK